MGEKDWIIRPGNLVPAVRHILHLAVGHFEPPEWPHWSWVGRVTYVVLLATAFWGLHLFGKWLYAALTVG